MLSKRNFVMMITMIMVILVLFLSTVVLKEYYNDYDVNHSAAAEVIEKKEQKADDVKPGSEIQDTEGQNKTVLYIGAANNGYEPVMKEWAGYRKRSLEVFESLEDADEKIQIQDGQKAYLLLDGQLLEKNTEEAAAKLTEYVSQGGVVIFYRLPSYETIGSSYVLQELLGIQHLRAESVRLHEIWLYSGFLLGGETCYSFEDVANEKVIDIEREVPWYDISSRTKTYMVGYVSAAEKASMGLNNEDMPAIIWRSHLGEGMIFAVNGDYMQGEAALGIMDAMVYEAEDYALYPVVNAQNLFAAGFPDLTVENEQTMMESYGMTTQQFCSDILWPSIVAAAQKGQWKITAFLSVRESDRTENEPSASNLVDYLKYFNEQSAEAGVSLGRIESTDIRASVSDEKATLDGWNRQYVFAGGYVRKENKDKLSSLLKPDGQMAFFTDIRTVVGEYESDTPVLSWLTDCITLQNATDDVYTHSYQDSLRLKSLQTALGYSNLQIDIYRVLWPKSSDDEWEKVAELMASNIDTYFKTFAAFDKTTISESDYRVRNFLNGSVKSTREENEITIRLKDFAGDAYLLLRTHGEVPKTMRGGTFKQVEDGTYLLTVTSDEAVITLKSKIETYYK